MLHEDNVLDDITAVSPKMLIRCPWENTPSPVSNVNRLSMARRLYNETEDKAFTWPYCLRNSTCSISSDSSFDPNL